MKNFGYVLASKMLVEQKLPVLFMYKEDSVNDDSGWRFFSGLENQEYVDNPDNISIYDVETILNIDNGIRSYLLLEKNCAYERSDVNDEFTEIEDFDFGVNLD